MLLQKLSLPERQRGQSLAEFLVVMVALMPLFAGIYYVGKYADLQQSAVQASRYAAFQRAMQPDEGRLSTAEIEDKLRARFFRRGKGLAGNPDGEIRSSDSVASLGAREGQVVFWRDLAGNPLLRDHQQVTLAFESNAPGSVTQVANGVAGMMFGQTNRGVHMANVEVSLIDHLRGGNDPLRIGASTAAMGGAWNAQGSQGVRSALLGNPVMATTLGGLKLVGRPVSGMVGLVERVRFELPCIKVEAVPTDRTSGGSAARGGSCQ